MTSLVAIDVEIAVGGSLLYDQASARCDAGEPAISNQQVPSLHFALAGPNARFHLPGWRSRGRFSARAVGRAAHAAALRSPAIAVAHSWAALQIAGVARAGLFASLASISARVRARRWRSASS